MLLVSEAIGFYKLGVCAAAKYLQEISGLQLERGLSDYRGQYFRQKVGDTVYIVQPNFIQLEDVGWAEGWSLPRYTEFKSLLLIEGPDLDNLARLAIDSSPGETKVILRSIQHSDGSTEHFKLQDGMLVSCGRS